MIKTKSRTLLLAALLGGTILSGAAGITAVRADQPITPAPITQALPDFADLVARVKPAVVSITTQIRAEAAADMEGTPTPFGRTRPNQPHGVEARGSGFLVGADGIVVTNNHVVENARSVSVTLDDGTQLSARVLGRDARTDLAVLKVEAGRKLPYLELGDSAHVRPGQWVVAVGNPFGLGGTVTAGIVSALGRDIGSGPYDDFLQIDAPINQGNSGGPLFTQDGRVVGVNTAILSPTGGSVGIGFAIPADTVRSVVAQLQNGGRVTRGYIGVGTQPVTDAIAAAMQLPRAEKPGDVNGALIASVEPDSPAAKAGIQPGDVIRAVNGSKIGTPRDLALKVAAVKPGDKAHLDIVRDGTAKTLAVDVGTIPNERTADRGDAGGEPGIGVGLAALSPDLRNQLDLPASAKGAIVAQVQPGSPAQRAGIREGDLIVGVGNRATNSVDEVTAAIRGASRDRQAVALRILRDGRTGYVAVDLARIAPKGDDAHARG
jgi:serine protease Do